MGRKMKGWTPKSGAVLGTSFWAPGEEPCDCHPEIRMESYGQTGWFEELIFHIQLLFLA
jgi:hypothetical protein